VLSRSVSSILSPSFSNLSRVDTLKALNASKLQEAGGEIKGTAEALVKAAKQQVKDVLEGNTDVKSPALLPYFQFRTLISSGQRAEDAMTRGVVFPPMPDSQIANWTVSGNRGGEEILKDFFDGKRLEEFMFYNAALSVKSRFMDRGLDHPYAPFAETIIKEFNDVASFRSGAKEMSKFFDDQLEYMVRSELISPEDAANFRKFNNPEKGTFYFPLGRKIDDQAATSTISRGGAIKPVVGGATDLKVNDLLDNMRKYITSSTAAADTNRAKLSLYRMIESKVESGDLPSGMIERITPSRQIEAFNAFKVSTLDKLEKLGLKIDDTDLDNTDGTFQLFGFSNGVRMDNGAEMLSTLFE